MKKPLVVVLLLLGAAVLLGAQGGGEGQPRSESGAGTVASDEPGQPLSSQQLEAIITAGEENTYLVDVRTPEEYRKGAIPTAINIPYDSIADNLPTTDRSARIILYCASGRRSGIAAQTLRDLGFSDVYNFGGVGNWQGKLVVRE